jgi:hypothetical protein
MTYWNILSKYGDFRIFFPSNLLILTHVFHKHPLYELDWMFLGCQVAVIQLKTNIAQEFFLI